MVDKEQLRRTVTVQMDVDKCYYNQYGLCHSGDSIQMDNGEMELTGWWKCHHLVDSCRCPGAKMYVEVGL